MDVIGSSIGETLTGTKGDDTYFGDAGNDTINATQGTDSIDGGIGTDRLVITTGDAALFDAFAGPRTYTITNSSATDSSGLLNSSLASIERVSINTRGTGDYDDAIDLRGFSSTASLSVQVTTGSGSDTVYGSAKNDMLILGLGSNWVDAGGGVDQVRFDHDGGLGGTMLVTWSAGALTATFNTQVNTVLNAESILIQNSSTTTGTRIDASAAAGYGGQLVFVNSLVGSDIFIGRNGIDFFSTNFQAVTGGDTYTGNGGADTYDYTFAVLAMNGDRITDLDADDIIDLQFNTPTMNGGGALANQFIGNANFSNSAGQYRYFASGGQTFLQADTNGDGIADQTLTIGNGQFALGETVAGSNQLKLIGTSGTAGADTLTGTKGNDAIYAQAGNDTINATQGSDSIDGGIGTDRLAIATGNAARFDAFAGPRTYTVTNSSATDSSGLLNSSLVSIERVSINTLGTGDYNDVIDLRGFTSAASSPVVVITGAGSDTVYGTATSDTLVLDLGSNWVDAGAGVDEVRFNHDSSSGGTMLVTWSAGALTATFNTQVNTVINAESILIQNSSTTAATYIDASGADGYAGQLVFVNSLVGSDVFIGHNGTDVFATNFQAVTGGDTYTGNGGADTYDYAFSVSAMNGDRITDFDADDIIDLQFNTPVNNSGGLLANQFIGNAAFSGVAGQYRYQIEGATTQLQVDTGGDGVADETLTIANGAFVLAETAVGSNQLHLASTITALDGVVADGYVAGATLFVDVDGDGERDAGEAWTTTDAAGNFTLNVNQAGTIVAVGGTNLDTGFANTMLLKAPFEASVVNPLTTLIAEVMSAQSLGAAAAESAVKTALGLDGALNLLTTDLLAPGGGLAALHAQQAAAMIANLVTSAEALPGAPVGAEAATLDALANLVGTGPINLTDAATIDTLLDTALGFDVPAAVANQLASEGTAIRAATTLADIANAQLSALLTGDDLGNVISGNVADNVLTGNGGDDSLYGLEGNDTLLGGAGRDRLYGGDGNDVLRGGDGFDFMTGGAGNDRFAVDYGTPVVTKQGLLSVDTVLDFQRGDKIDLSFLDANTRTAADEAFAFKGSGVSKDAGTVWFKSYDSVQGAEKALNIDLDGFAGASPFHGPVTIVFGNHNGGDADFAVALIGVSTLSMGDFML